MFYKHGVSRKLIVLLVYVDDLTIIGDNIEEIENLKQKLSTEFDIKTLKTLHYFLRIEIAHSK